MTDFICPHGQRFHCPLCLADLRRKMGAPFSVASVETDPMPAPDVVRPDWWERSFLTLTPAERELFRERAAATVTHARRVS